MEHIFTLWPSIAELARDLGKPYPTVASWYQRGSIPARFDLSLVRAARARGHDLTLEMIAAARERGAPQEQDRGAA